MSFFLLQFLSLGFVILSFLPLLKKRYAASLSAGHGPPSYPIVGCLVSFYKNRRRLLDWYTGLLSESPTLTISLTRPGVTRIVVTANPKNVEHVLKTNFANYPKGKPFTDLLGDFLGVGIFNSDGELWTTQRKLASHAFSAKSLRDFVFETLREEVEDRLLPVMERASRDGDILDLQDVLRKLAFDAVCKVSLGFDPRCLDPMNRPGQVLADAFDAAAHASAMRGVAPIYVTWKLKRLFNVGSESKLRTAVKTVHEFVNDIVRERREKMRRETGERRDLLSRLILAGHEDALVRDMAISFLMAGRDTTSASMTWLFWLLTWNPGVEAKILDEVMPKNCIANCEMGFEDLKKMNYLKACLCESMRLYPPVAWDSKHASADDVLPDGTPVRKGDRVTYFPYGMGRMGALWGEGCMDFVPERFLDEGGSFREESPYKFPVFQGGPRVCLGKEMAFIQMKYVVASVLRRFELRPVQMDRPVFVPLLTAHMAGGFKVRVHRRSG